MFYSFLIAGISGADPEGGAGGARPPLFASNYLKSPPKKNLGGKQPSPLRPLLFQIPDLPLYIVIDVVTILISF